MGQPGESKRGAAEWARILFYANAAIWMPLAAITVVRAAGGTREERITGMVLTVLMFGNAVAMVLSALGLARRSRWFYLFAVAVVVVNLLLTWTDQVGWLDVVTGVLDLVLLGLLVVVRREYWG
ncbi:MAG TPA: hypothetical protein PKW05_04405 [Anaerolineae bacterium]|nr:hypothetical protein [Anaerolineae bacterium]